MAAMPTPRRLATRIALSGAGSIVGAVVGAVAPWISFKSRTSPDPLPEEAPDSAKQMFVLSARARSLFTLRSMLEDTVVPSLASLEYETRRRLEQFNYFPCELCFKVHANEACDLPYGAYVDADSDEVLCPGDPGWERSEYEARADKEYTGPVNDEDDNDRDPLH